MTHTLVTYAVCYIHGIEREHFSQIAFLTRKYVVCRVFILGNRWKLKKNKFIADYRNILLEIKNLVFTSLFVGLFKYQKRFVPKFTRSFLIYSQTSSRFFVPMYHIFMQFTQTKLRFMIIYYEFVLFVVNTNFPLVFQQSCYSNYYLAAITQVNIVQIFDFT